jgi:CubicO group peptidase (beta-lactamase class C family)
VVPRQREGVGVADVHGFCDERFAALEDAFRDFLDTGVDKGSSLAVTEYGEPIVDLWGGTRDYEQAEAWEADTVVRVFSTSKVIVMITVLLLIDRGLLDLDAPIVECWPEFGRNGKDTITARQVLLHQSGLPGFGRSTSFDELQDWDRAMTMLEDATPWYEPGTMSCYAPQTFGHILGELTRRLSGVPFDEYVRRELTEPLEADFHFAYVDDPTRVAALWPADRAPEFESAMAAAAFGELAAIGEWIDPGYLGSMMPAGSGITNGRGLARLGSVVASGGAVDGRRYLSSEIVTEAAREQSFEHDEMLGPLRLGLGFGLDSDGFPAPTPTALHWGGYGGSFLTMDPATGISCGFAPSQLMVGDAFGDDPRLTTYWRLLGKISNDLA